MGNASVKKKDTDIELQTTTNTQNAYEGLNRMSYAEYSEIEKSQQPRTSDTRAITQTGCQKARWWIFFLAICVAFGLMVVLHFFFPVFTAGNKDKKEKNTTSHNEEKYQNELHEQEIKGEITKLQMQLHELSNMIEVKSDVTKLQEQLHELSKKIESITECDDGWIRYERKCYFFSISTADWYQAKEQCIGQYNAKLAEPETQTEISYLRSQASKGSHSYWIGGTDKDNEGQWVWDSDKRLIKQFNWAFTDRYGQEPNNDKGGTEDYLELHSGIFKFKWNDETSSTNNRYICEKCLCR